MIHLSAEAEADLDDIATKIAEDNGRAVALAVLDRIASALDQLSHFPQLGRPGRVPRTRELVIPRLPFIAVYQPAPGAIAVLRIIHGARQWPPLNP